MRPNPLAMLSSLLLFLAYSLSWGAENASRTVTIPVNVAYSANSLWTKEEILKRFEYTNAVYQSACTNLEIKIELRELVRIDSEELQDLEAYPPTGDVRQIRAILARFSHSLRPTIFYTRRAITEGSFDLTDVQAQAFTFDGPRALAEFESYNWNQFSFKPDEPIKFAVGNLDWEQFDVLKPVHGLITIAQFYSEKYSGGSDLPADNKFGVDSHELGHVLLNDGSHRFSADNVMGSERRRKFDSDQCAMIAAYHESEALRFQSVKRGIDTICSIAEAQQIEDRPRYCRQTK